MEALVVVGLILGFFLFLVAVHEVRALRRRRLAATDAEAAHAWHSQQRWTDERRKRNG